ncbi:MAG TPA: glutamyl-tRNA reductase, partial [Candidatus Dormibacteraeota bacterium]|nr:glutamyl-tRNA reductase [Candidatus Dormibacteraeota bacterium]
QNYLYELTDEDAVQHLISVTAGLDSLATGEQQIQEQVKQALRESNRVGTSGRYLTELFKHADNAASNIRRRSGLDAEQISVSSAVIFLLKQLARDQKIITVLLVGAGKMMSLAAEDLTGLPGVEVWVANRTTQRAKDLAMRFRGKAIGLSDVPAALGKVDVVITCTSSTDYILRTEELRTAVEQRGNKPLFLIDVAVPRNVDPQAKVIPGLKVYDIDDLAPFGEELGASFQAKLNEAKQLVREETRNFYGHLRAYDANDLLKDLMNVAEDIREKELSRALKKLGDVPGREKTILDLLTRRIVNKLLYEPTLRLKAHATNGDGENYETVIRELFNIGGQSEQ